MKETVEDPRHKSLLKRKSRWEKIFNWALAITAATLVAVASGLWLGLVGPPALVLVVSAIMMDGEETW